MSTRITGAKPEKLEDISLGEKIPTAVSYVAESEGLVISASTSSVGYTVSLLPADGSAPPVLGKKGSFVTSAHLVIGRDETAAPVGNEVEIKFRIGSSLGFPILLGVKK